MSNINILFEDSDILIIDKPAGLTIHEGAGQNQQLLTEWIKVNKPEIVSAFANEPSEPYFRPGIIHRLDKDTSGLLIIAKNPIAKEAFQHLFKNRLIEKHYKCLVLGRPNPLTDRIETYICRNPHHRREMMVSLMPKGKLATTDYQTLESYPYNYKGQVIPISLLNISLHSGRMHQIRVHLKNKGWPIIGDQTYKTKISRNISQAIGLERQFLHAQRLIFIHPLSKQKIDIISQLPNELQLIINKLTKNDN